MELFRTRRAGGPSAPGGGRRFDGGEVDAAGAAVARALRHRGLSPVLATGAVIAVAIPDTLPTILAGVPAIPLPRPGEGTARALEQALLLHDIRARVTVIELPAGPAPQITFTGPVDAHTFAQLVLRELPADQRAAERLRHVLQAAGITTIAPTAVLGVVTIGTIAIPHALLLLRLLGGRTKGLPDHPWQRATVLATWLTSALTTELPAGPAIRVYAQPEGVDCSCEPSIALGEVMPERAVQLADTIKTATSRLLLPTVRAEALS
ncbi:hypothetical protein [Streptomyces sp. CAU 1734]|uniref:hypothetical protein n=1 Tax=Streptomyces sp. CAU 1734 TaxID=3140360 RepID=UPI0032605102